MAAQASTRTRVVLVQVRAGDDPMIEHELQCVRRRLGERAYELTTYNAVVQPASVNWLDGQDALIIGGSGDFSVHHPKSVPWVTPLRHVIEAALERDVAGFGICFGHQLLGRHLGADVVTDPDTAEMGTVEVSLTETGAADELCRGLPLKFPVHTGHSDCVTTIPSNVELLASNDRLLTQAFKVKDRLFYSVQFHPDMSGAEARARYLAYRAGFADRLDESALTFAEKFHLDDDISTEFLGRFLDVVQSR